jgi:hypothetical protein
MRNSFIRLGDRLINLDYITHIEKEKGEGGYDYMVYMVGKEMPMWLVDGSSAEGKALGEWFGRMSVTYTYDQEGRTSLA